MVYLGVLGNYAYQAAPGGDMGVAVEKISSDSHTFDDGAFCSAVNGSSCQSDGRCHSGSCEQNVCVLSNAFSSVTPMCEPHGGGETLAAGDAFTSCDGRYSLIMQDDGNLVVYNGLSKPVWATGTQGAGNTAVFQDDGNLVVYAPGGVPLWESGTGGNWGSTFIMQNDGNLVIYRSDGGAIFSTNTFGK